MSFINQGIFWYRGLEVRIYGLGLAGPYIWRDSHPLQSAPLAWRTVRPRGAIALVRYHGKARRDRYQLRFSTQQKSLQRVQF